MLRDTVDRFLRLQTVNQKELSERDDAATAKVTAANRAILIRIVCIMAKRMFDDNLKALTLQLVCLFLTNGLTQGLKCYQYIQRRDGSESRLWICEMQEPSYCVRYVEYNSSDHVIYQELRCKAKNLPSILVLDTPFEDTCNTTLTTENGHNISVQCCEQDYCNKKVEQPTVPPSRIVSTTVEWSKYLTATVIIGVISLILMVVFGVGLTVYYLIWQEKYKKLKSQSGSSEQQSDSTRTETPMSV